MVDHEASTTHHTKESMDVGFCRSEKIADTCAQPTPGEGMDSRINKTSPTDTSIAYPYSGSGKQVASILCLHVAQKAGNHSERTNEYGIRKTRGRVQ